MPGAKDAAMIILGAKPKSGGMNRRDDGDEEVVGEEEEYSDDQLQMAGELKSALMDGNENDILAAIHGIMMSYEDYS